MTGPRVRLPAELTARIALTLGALLPYWRFLTFRVLYITDDFFTSDIFHGDLPVRVLVGQMIRHGQVPAWTNQLCSGLPLGAAPLEPIGLAAFSTLPPAPALDLLVIVLLLVAAHGAYALTRRFGADRLGAVLAGLSFAGSGYIAAQLKHLAIVSTVVWLPVGLLLLDRVLAPEALVAAPSPDRPLASTTIRRRAFLITIFGLVFAEQVLSGFPQSAYICALTYGSFAIFRAFTNRQRIGRLPMSLVLLAGLAIAVSLAVAAGAVNLLTIAELGVVSDRSQPLGWEWTTLFPYWPRNILTFLMPYINGDISNDTYWGPSLFWEDYGYVGVVTFVLAIYGAIRQRRRGVVRFVTIMTAVAFSFVLGGRSLLFYLAYLLVPGMKVFRFPTRFLIVVDLGIAVLGGLGLTSLRSALERRFSKPSDVPQLVVIGLSLVTAFDLSLHQPRQNPIVPAREWLNPPGSIDIVRADGPNVRTFTAGSRDIHRLTFVVARGWQDVSPYYELREMLQPNTGGGFWDVPSADCYVGIAPRWSVDVWSDHNREESIVTRLAHVDLQGQRVRPSPQLANLLRAYGVTHFLAASRIQDVSLPLAGRSGMAYVYRVLDSARVRFVPSARRVASDHEAADRLIDPTFDPDREVLLHDAPESASFGQDISGERLPTQPRPTIERENPDEVVIGADTPADGFLLLADTYYPGWIATVDGLEVPIYRANLSVRAIPLPKGTHKVKFAYRSQTLRRGLAVTFGALALLFLAVVVTATLDRVGH